MPVGGGRASDVAAEAPGRDQKQEVGSKRAS